MGVYAESVRDNNVYLKKGFRTRLRSSWSIENWASYGHSNVICPVFAHFVHSKRDKLAQILMDLDDLRLVWKTFLWGTLLSLTPLAYTPTVYMQPLLTWKTRCVYTHGVYAGGVSNNNVPHKTGFQTSLRSSKSIKIWASYSLFECTKCAIQDTSH